MTVTGDNKDMLELKWVDYDGKITWEGNLNETFKVNEYHVEFASASKTWMYIYLPDCTTEKVASDESQPRVRVGSMSTFTAITTCTYNMTGLTGPPLSLTGTDLVRARVWAVNSRTGMKAPSDGWNCVPSDGKGSFVFLGQQASYYGDVANCEPAEDGQATIITRKDYVFEGQVREKGNTRIGKYTLADQTAIGGTFTGDGLNGWYTVSYPGGLTCTETWSEGKRVDSIGSPECLKKVKGKN